MAKWGAKKTKKLLESIEDNKNKLNESVQNAQKINDQLMGILNEAGNKSSAINKIEADASKIFDDAKSSASDVQNIKNEIENLKSASEKLLETSTILSEEIKSQLGIAAGGSLSHTFDKRKDELEKSKNIWRNLFIFNIFALFGVAFFVFFELKDHAGFTVNAFLKISLSFPLIYSAIFFHGQYNKEREYLEEYAFKSAVSFSLEAYKKLLVEDIDSDKPDEQNKFIEFIIDSIKGIYDSPCRVVSARLDQKEIIEIGALDKVVGIIKRLIKD